MTKDPNKKVLLIKAAHHSPLQEGITHPLGIMTLASVLRSKGYLAKIVDTRILKPNIIRIIEEYKPDFIGISAITYESDNMFQIAKKIKQYNKNIPIIAGGPFPTSSPEEVLNSIYIDFIVLGEGENSFPLLLHSIEENLLDISKIDGIGYKNQSKIHYKQSNNYIENLDSIPLPAWDLIDLVPYFHYKAESNMPPPRRYASLFTSRGCPYKCIYCHNIFGKKLRTQSVKRIIDEIIILKDQYKINEFEILDDSFNIDKQRVIKFCTEIIKKNLNIKLLFPNGLRTDLLDKETLLYLKNAGTTYISFAVETASKRLQKNIGKNLNLEKVKNNIIQAEKINIATHGFFILGLPDETKEEALLTIDFAVKSKLTTAAFFILTPYKGTKIYNDHINTHPELEQNQNSMEYFSLTTNLSKINNNALLKIYNNAYIKFYRSIPRILRILKRYPLRKHLFRYMKLILKRMYLSSHSKNS